MNGPVIRQLVEASGVPCQLGGGIRTEADLAAVFDWGVRWAVLGTRALQDPAWVRSIATRFPDRIVLGLDAKDGFVATEGWLSVSRVQAVDLAKEIESSTLAAIVYTDIATDGMMAGPNFDALARLQGQVKLPVIASGGVCTVEHVAQLAAADSYGCIIGRALYEGSLALADVLAAAAVRRPQA